MDNVEMADNAVNKNNKRVFNKNFGSPKQQTHTVRKRCPPHLRRKNDVYVTSKSNFQAQRAQCEKLIGDGEDEVVLHGIGAAIPRTINLALQLNEKYQGTFDLHVETSTVALVDDLEPLTDDVDYESRTRQNSAISIRVAKNKECPVNQL